MTDEYRTLIEGRRERFRERAIRCMEMTFEEKLSIIKQKIETKEGFGFDIVEDDTVYKLADVEFTTFYGPSNHWCLHDYCEDKYLRGQPIEAIMSSNGVLTLVLKAKQGDIERQYNLGNIIICKPGTTFSIDLDPDYEEEAIHAIMMGHPQEAQAWAILHLANMTGGDDE